MSRPADMIWRIIGALYVVFLLTPLLLVVLFSFTNRGIAAFPIEHFSLQWWRAMIDDPEFFPALKNSLMIGGTAIRPATSARRYSMPLSSAPA